MFARKKRVVRKAAYESQSCIVVKHLVFAAMSNWPGCSGFAEISPPGSGDGEVGGFPGGDDLSGKHARVDIAQPGASLSPRSPSAFRPVTRMEPSLFQVIERMNKDRLGYAYAPRDVRASVMVTKLQLYWGSKLKKKKEGWWFPRNCTCFMQNIPDSYRFFWIDIYFIIN